MFKDTKDKSNKNCTDKINQLEKERKTNHVHRN